MPRGENNPSPLIKIYNTDKDQYLLPCDRNYHKTIFSFNLCCQEMKTVSPWLSHAEYPLDPVQITELLYKMMKSSLYASVVLYTLWVKLSIFYYPIPLNVITIFASV